jgi:hypothetical protein
MTTAVRERVAVPRGDVAPVRRRVVRALAVIEARRLLRSPLVWLGLVLAVVYVWGTFQSPPDWSGARYVGLPDFIGPVAAGISMAVAGAFHRERIDPTGAGPVGEGTRAAGRLTGSLVLVGLVVLLTGVGAALARWHGGFDLGDEPGRTLHAQYSWPEILQPVCLALVAVGAGAVAGRRFRRRATATLTLFVGWFPVAFVPWAFQSTTVAPFSILQLQPLTIDVGPVGTDPLSFPSSWLLLVPGEYQDFWGRAFTSIPLGVGHDLWLLGLAAVLTALALPRRRLLPLLAAGLVVAAAGVALQYAVIP